MRVHSNEVSHCTTRGGQSKRALIVIAKNSTLVTKLHCFWQLLQQVEARSSYSGRRLGDTCFLYRPINLIKNLWRAPLMTIDQTQISTPAQATEPHAERHWNSTDLSQHSPSPLDFRATQAEMYQIERDSLRTLEQLRDSRHPHIRVVSFEEAPKALASPDIGGVIIDQSLDVPTLSKLTEFSLSADFSACSVNFSSSSMNSLVGMNAVIGQLVRGLKASTQPQFEDNEIRAIVQHYAAIIGAASSLGEVQEFPLIYRENSAISNPDWQEIDAAERVIHVDEDPLIIETYGLSRTRLYLPDAVCSTGGGDFELKDPEGVITVPHGRPLIMKAVVIPDQGSGDFQQEKAYYDNQPGIKHSRAEIHHSKTMLRLPIYSAKEFMYLGL
jgi:hypothetical protein